MEVLQLPWMTCVLVSLLISDSLYALPCANVKISNGRARVKGKGKYIEFKCNPNYELVGVKIAVCLASGQWSKNIPSCVGTTCQQPALQKDVIVDRQYKGGLLTFSCGVGLTRSGPETIMCDGQNWTSQPPKCIEAITLDCDFENGNLCGWNQDNTDDFDWTWHKGETPTANTGPRFDHTTNSSEGHYLFMESSAPQKTGQTTRLISPPHVASNMETVCLEFFYHMFGPDGMGEVGNLDVYIRPQSMINNSLASANNVFHRSGNQGDLWIHAEVELPQQADVFTIILQGTRLKSWSGDIAIDDIRVYPCLENLTTSSGSANVNTVTQSTDSNKESDDETSVPRKVTNRPATTKAPFVTATKKTKLPKPALKSRATLTPTTNVASTVATFSRASKPSRKLFTPTPTIPYAQKTSPYNNVTLDTAAMLTFNTQQHSRQQQPFTYVSTSVASTLASNISSGQQGENDFARYNASTGSYNETDRNNYFKQITDGKPSYTTDYNTINSDSRSSKNKPVGKNDSKTPFPDYDDATVVSSKEYQAIDGLMDDTATISENSSSPGPIALLPLILGIAASVVVGIVVTVIMACIWVRNQRVKQDKHQDDQMNIMSDYTETNLCT